MVRKYTACLFCSIFNLKMLYRWESRAASSYMNFEAAASEPQSPCKWWPQSWELFLLIIFGGPDDCLLQGPEKPRSGPVREYSTFFLIQLVRQTILSMSHIALEISHDPLPLNPKATIPMLVGMNAVCYIHNDYYMVKCVCDCENNI